MRETPQSEEWGEAKSQAVELGIYRYLKNHHGTSHQECICESNHSPHTEMRPSYIFTAFIYGSKLTCMCGREKQG